MINNLLACVGIYLSQSRLITIRHKLVYNLLNLISIFTVYMYILSSAVQPGTHFFENNKIIGVFTMLKLREQRTISAVTLHLMLNAIRRTQPKQSICHCFSTVMMSKLTHFKPLSSSDVTKIKDTFYII